jgi:hypothetical protein
LRSTTQRFISRDIVLGDLSRVFEIALRLAPNAVIGLIKDEGLVFKGMICTKTLYNYIDKGIFSGINNDNLREKRKKRSVNINQSLV